jgi:hypothetical protein
LPLWSHLTVTGNFNLIYDVEDQTFKKKCADGILNDTKPFIFALERLINRPLKKNYSGYTVFPGVDILFTIPPPPRALSHPSFNGAE